MSIRSYSQRSVQSDTEGCLYYCQMMRHTLTCSPNMSMPLAFQVKESRKARKVKQASLACRSRSRTDLALEIAATVGSRRRLGGEYVAIHQGLEYSHTCPLDSLAEQTCWGPLGGCLDGDSAEPSRYSAAMNSVALEAACHSTAWHAELRLQQAP